MARSCYSIFRIDNLNTGARKLIFTGDLFMYVLDLLAPEIRLVNK